MEFILSLEFKEIFDIVDNIEFELSKHRIKYIDKTETERIYCPDIVVGDTVYEIKPLSMIDVGENQNKFKAAKEYCDSHELKFDIITEKAYNIKDLFDEVCSLIGKGVFLDEINTEKLNRNIKNGEIKWLLK